jgi:hypothetical protein
MSFNCVFRQCSLHLAALSAPRLSAQRFDTTILPRTTIHRTHLLLLPFASLLPPRGSVRLHLLRRWHVMFQLAHKGRATFKQRRSVLTDRRCVRGLFLRGLLFSQLRFDSECVLPSTFSNYSFDCGMMKDRHVMAEARFADLSVDHHVHWLEYVGASDTPHAFELNGLLVHQHCCR